MHRNIAIAIGVAAVVSAGLGAVIAQQKATGPVLEVFKTPTCGCCAKWVEYMRENGFTARTTDMNDLSELKKTRGVPERVQSCHTAVVNGYVVEGHVPAADVHRLIKEKPAIAGIAVGGMPVGSPGMEFPGARAERFNVVSFDKAGTLQVFAKH